MTQVTLDFAHPAHACNLRELLARVSPDIHNAARMLVRRLIVMGAVRHQVAEGDVVTRVHDLMMDLVMRGFKVKLRAAYTLARFLSDVNGEYCPSCSVPKLVKLGGWVLVSYGPHGENRDVAGKGMLRLMTRHQAEKEGVQYGID